MSLTDLSNSFRDDEQRRRVQAVIHDRLADDRDPQECRYLMQFWWQLSMSYQEVSMKELSLNVGKPKLDVIEELISAIRSSHAEIDAWVATAQQAFPVIQDRGFRTAPDGGS
ncbi:hypothetical protein [Streptomyces sp. MA15]|uniref:hypothetical protein n=1 Tax=Streptomyces sp. MA15 TaxID=3055061 RepID=UPI0025AF3B97|nr:hypothetical protein [Streptomyces sp. MA15]MDN3272446.1 hypothetical protein [Streptomyces sp. MA15]